MFIRVENNIKLFLLLFFISLETAIPCSCIAPPPPDVAFVEYDAVFTAKVIDMKIIPGIIGYNFYVELEVLQTWKGVTSDNTFLVTSMSDATCGFPFQPDSTYLIYAILFDDTLYTNICSRTRCIWQAEEDLAYLITLDVNDNFNITDFSLSQNYPNPFNPTTKIGFRIANFGLVTLRIYDVLGKEITTLVNEYKPAGNYEVEFDASSFPSGVYFYQLKAGDFIKANKMNLLK